MERDLVADAEASVYPEDPLAAADLMRQATSRLREDLAARDAPLFADPTGLCLD